MKRRDFLRKSLLAATGSMILGGGIMKAVENLNTKNSSRMKIVVLTGSPRRNGNSAYLAEQFIKGAQEKGHEIYRFDCAFKQVGPCRACNHCGMDGPCVIRMILMNCVPTSLPPTWWSSPHRCIILAFQHR